MRRPRCRVRSSVHIPGPAADGAPGRRRCRRRLGRRVPTRQRSWPLPLGGTLDLAIAPERARKPRGLVMVGTVSAGGVRAGADGGFGLGMTRSSSAAMATLTTPNSSSRAAPSSSRLGRPGRSRSGLRVTQRRRLGRALHSPRACRWRSSAAASRSSRQWPVNPADSVERFRGTARDGWKRRLPIRVRCRRWPTPYRSGSSRCACSSRSACPDSVRASGSAPSSGAAVTPRQPSGREKCPLSDPGGPGRKGHCAARSAGRNPYDPDRGRSRVRGLSRCRSPRLAFAALSA